jgi:protein gp37
MAQTKIEWTATVMSDGSALPGFTHNPWIGCTRVSSACDACYAEALSKRRGWAEWGNHPRHRTSEANRRQPLIWNRKAAISGVRRKVFCASLADVFDNQVPIEWLVDLLDLIHETTFLDWLLLTKRPQNIVKRLRAAAESGRGVISGAVWQWLDGCNPPANVWLGTTAENQTEADRRIPHLLGVPATLRFLSCEPLLGPLNLEGWLSDETSCEWCDDGGDGPNRCSRKDVPRDEQCPRNRMVYECQEGPRDKDGTPEWVGENTITIDWVICGGESGPNARPMHPDWARSLRDQCQAAEVPFFFKQWGEWLPTGGEDGWYADHPVSLPLRAWDGQTWTDDGRIDGEWMARIGKKAAGRLLDGREWNEMPHA